MTAFIIKGVVGTFVLTLLGFWIYSWSPFRDYVHNMMSIDEHKTSLLGWMSLGLMVLSMYMCLKLNDIPQNLSTALVTTVGCFAGATSIYTAVTNISQNSRSRNVPGMLQSVKSMLNKVNPDMPVSSNTVPEKENGYNTNV